MARLAGKTALIPGAGAMAREGLHVIAPDTLDETARRIRAAGGPVEIRPPDKRHGIRGNSAHPGQIRTPQTENRLAFAVLCRASDDSTFVTGAGMSADDGYLMV